METPAARVQADQLAEVLARCVVPLFGIRGGRELRLFGTGTLVQIGGGPAFLFTAGHVMDIFVHERSAMYVLNGKRVVKITGDGFTSEPRRPARSKDSIDLAFLQITRDTARELSEAEVLFADAFRLSHTHPVGGIYVTIGYPLAPNEEPPFSNRLMMAARYCCFTRSTRCFIVLVAMNGTTMSFGERAPVASSDGSQRGTGCVSFVDAFRGTRAA